MIVKMNELIDENYTTFEKESKRIGFMLDSIFVGFVISVMLVILLWQFGFNLKDVQLYGFSGYFFGFLIVCFLRYKGVFLRKCKL
jgi:di/tricarboxylate transporter